MRVLNVGSGGRDTVIPPIYEGWEVVRMDLNPVCEPDILMDIGDLNKLDAYSYDAVYCSHVIEHLYRHELPGVMRDVWGVLTPDGFVDIVVPNIGWLFEQIRQDPEMDLDRVLYHTPGGPISVADILWGYAPFQAFSREPELMLHRNGFTRRTLGMMLMHSGFSAVFQTGDGCDLRMMGFKRLPDLERRQTLQIRLPND